MTVMEWEKLTVNDGILREPLLDSGRVILWLRGPAEHGFQYWQRLANVPGEEIYQVGGICSTPATLLQARQKMANIIGKLLRRFQKPTAGKTWLLPNGGSAEQVGERQDNVILAWPANQGDSFDEERLRRLWPNSAEFQRLGTNLYLVSGVAKPKPTPLPNGDPWEQATQMLSAARREKDRRAEAVALTDSAVVALRNGDGAQAVAFLEEALPIAAELEDRALENDMIGNLGDAYFLLGQGQRAEELLQQQLTYARTAGNRFAERNALAILGEVYTSLRHPTQAIDFYEQAMQLSREFGDLRSQGELTWGKAIQHAELGENQKAIEIGQTAISIYREMGAPQAKVLAEYLEKYKLEGAGGLGVMPTPFSQPRGEMIVGATPSGRATASGPGLLHMALSAAETAGKFIGSGLKIVPAATAQKRLKVCSICEHHTGVRCRVCGCFTKIKAKLPHERCPIGKWLE